ncbi:MAG: type II toxin-antitoxin system VapC family toxin [Kineosporiaceae bacterium]
MIVDTGVLVAALVVEDNDHASCRELLEHIGQRVLIPGLCLAEVDYWLRERHGLHRAGQDVLELVASGAWQVEWPTPQQYERAVSLCASGPELGIVDAALLALAEDREETEIASLDHRHLSTVELSHGHLSLRP